MAKPDTKKRPYVVIRNDMAGVICGVLLNQNEHRTELAEARRQWHSLQVEIETLHALVRKHTGLDLSSRLRLFPGANWSQRRT